MRQPKTLLRVLLLFVAYGMFSIAAGIFIAEATLHPARRPLPRDAESATREIAQSLDSSLENVQVVTRDGVTLRAWSVRPRSGNGDAVILLHGMADNRLGMAGYGQLLLRHGFAVLMPDARAHGASGGDLATYGLLERNDIRLWADWLNENQHPRCIFGFGESMGAAQLLQSLATAPFCAVVAESSFSTFHEVAYDRVGQFFHLGPWVGSLALRPLVEVAFFYARWKYESDLQLVSPADSVAATKTPVLLIHGQKDGNIPVRHSRLIQSRNPNVSLWEVPNADHCGAVSVAPQEFEQRLVGWFNSHSDAKTRSDISERVP